MLAEAAADIRLGDRNEHIRQQRLARLPRLLRHTDYILERLELLNQGDVAEVPLTLGNVLAHLRAVVDPGASAPGNVQEAIDGLFELQEVILEAMRGPQDDSAVEDPVACERAVGLPPAKSSRPPLPS
jgi:hypothetical protein